jgi:hypothetical protein
MEPRGEGRYCARCERVVADLTALTRREAVALFHARGGELCGYLAFDATGAPLHAPEPRPLALGAVVATFLAACDPEPPDPTSAHAPIVLAVGSPSGAPDPVAQEWVMRPIDPGAPSPPGGAVAEAARAGSDEVGGEPTCESTAPGEAVASAEGLVPTPADRARERHKRAARRPQVPPPHTAYAGMMMLDD